jgi:hypothetical protein
MWTMVSRCRGGWVVHGWCVAKGFWFTIRHFKRQRPAAAFAAEKAAEMIE